MATLIITQQEVDEYKFQTGHDMVDALSGIPIKAGDEVEIQEVPPEDPRQTPYVRVVKVKSEASDESAD